MLAIALAFCASPCWGSGDSLGGLTTRRAGLWAVSVGSQAAGMVAHAPRRNRQRAIALVTPQDYLSLDAVLGSVYRVVTIPLAYGLLHEHVARHQMVGAGATPAGIALIAAR